MKPKTIAKLAVDILMTVLLLLLMGYHFWGKAAHEWIGAGILLLFVAMHLLNLSWHKSIFKGHYTAARVFTLCVDVFIMLAMLAQVYSGMVMSRYVFGFFANQRGYVFGAPAAYSWRILGLSFDEPAFGNSLEYDFGYAAKSSGNKKQNQKPQYYRFHHRVGYRRIWRAGIYQQKFFDLSVFEKRVCVFDYSEPKFLFYIDYLALMGLCVFAAHYIPKLLRNAFKKREKRKV